MTKKKKNADALRHTHEPTAWQAKINKERIAPYDFPIRNNWMNGSVYDGKELDYRGKKERKVMA